MLAALKRVEVEECVRWMVPFAIALQEVGGSSMRTFTGISADDMHNIQTHASYITWLVRESVSMLERFTGREKLGAAPLIMFNSRQLIVQTSIHCIDYHQSF